MSTIPIPPIPSTGVNLVQQAQQQNQAVGTSDFESLLLSMGAGSANSSTDSLSGAGDSDPMSGFIEELLDNITSSRSGDFSTQLSQAQAPGTFPFSAAFQSTFGTSGPLLNFINIKTEELHLTAEQNQSFQNIAIENKDIVKTPASVQKVALELQQAGIGYPAASVSA